MGDDLAATRAYLSEGAALRVQPSARVRRLAKIAVLSVQVALVALVVRGFAIEGEPFLRLCLVALAGFIVQEALPARHRLLCFLAVSLVGIVAVLGPAPAAWLLGIGTALVGMCHLPLSHRWRVALVAAAGAGLAALRVAWADAPVAAAVWPILGSMFMFRMVLYLYEIRHEQEPISPWYRLSYFFLLPNVCFPLFPVVDYTTFRDSYRADDRHRVQQVGIWWMLRGILHLLLYRAVYHYGVLDPSEVATRWDLLRFLVCNFALYLRVSGTFHIIAGMLRLFGFELPETHHLYFFSSGVNDLWRRVNIYWKDFMQKIFFYPAFFRLRRGGTARALVLSTLVVVSMTWVLHSYQYFWIAGTFPVTWQDGAFWAMIGAFMIGNTLYDDARSERRSGGGSRLLPRPLARVLQTAATFLLVCTLWSLWTCESFDQWLALWPALWRGGGGMRAAAIGPSPLPSLPIAAVVGGLALGSSLWTMPRVRLQNLGFWQAALVTTALLVGLSAATAPSVYRRFGPAVSRVVHSLRTDHLNRLDEVKLQRSYYEDIMNSDRVDSPLAKLRAGKPASWIPVRETSAGRSTGDFLEYELRPSASIEFHGAPLHVDRWGMRDRDYALHKPAHTYRIAVVGSSYVMGNGVADAETFENVLEERLNRERAAGEPAYEVLNFGVGGYSPLQNLMVVERKVFRFEPDAVFYVVHGDGFHFGLAHLARLAAAGIEAPDPELRELLAGAGFAAGVSEPVLAKGLRGRWPQLTRWLLRRMAHRCAENGAVPVLVYVPKLQASRRRRAPRITRVARREGFEIVDLSGVYEGRDPAKLRVAEWDKHPNAAGHRLIADGLFAKLRGKKGLLSRMADGAGEESGR